MELSAAPIDSVRLVRPPCPGARFGPAQAVVFGFLPDEVLSGACARRRLVWSSQIAAFEGVI